jgi:DNA repair protein RadC
LSTEIGKKWSEGPFFPHNHPSGNLGASDADTRITKNVKEVLKLVDIELLDHLILTYEEKYATIE